MWNNSTKFPLNIKLGSNLIDSEKDAISNAATSWSNSTNHITDFFNLSDSDIEKKSNLSSYKDAEFGIYKLYEWPSSLPQSALAVTQIYGTKRNTGSSKEYIEINHADILINFDYFSFSTDDSWGYDLQTVILHELGHFIGLYHNNISSEYSVMYPTISRYSINRTPASFDIEEVENKYQSNKYLNESSAQNRALINENATSLSTQEEDLEDITIIFELYPNNKERTIIKRGDKNEIINVHNHH